MTFNDTYSDGQFKKTADNNKLMKMLPEFKFTEIEDGIASTVKYFKDNYPNLRL